MKIKYNTLELGERSGDYVSNFAVPIVNDHRDEIVKELQDNDIEVRPLIAGNMANKPMWKGRKDNLPNCDMLDKNGFYIPNHQDLTIEEIDLIINIVNFEYTT